MEILLVAFGGSLGSLARFKIGKILTGKGWNSIPLGTFFVNITGAFFLGVFSGFSGSSGIGGIYLSRFLGDGFFGAYTTFSTFMYQGFNFFQEKKQLNALVYIFTSIILGIIGFIIGNFVIRTFSN